MKYFKPEEFNCPDCQHEQMDDNFLIRLELAREYAFTPFSINSGWRCEKHNKEVGGAPTSAHLFGKAVDIQATTPRQRFRILYGLIKAGFTRIGIAKTFIHADSDGTKDAEVVWLY